MIGDPRSSRALRRRMLRELGPSAVRVDGMDGQALRALRRARLRDLERPAPEPLPERPPETDEREAVATQLHWIEIALVGEDDRPIPGVRYEIELPDGRVRRGRLDPEGKARVDGIEDAGECKVSFPDLDQDAWSRI